MSGASHRDYPVLECPICDRLCKPIRLNKDQSVSYKCPPQYGDGSDKPSHGNAFSWRIDVDGNLIE